MALAIPSNGESQEDGHSQSVQFFPLNSDVEKCTLAPIKKSRRGQFPLEGKKVEGVKLEILKTADQLQHKAKGKTACRQSKRESLFDISKRLPWMIQERD